MIDSKLEYILANLLWSRIKAKDNPCASDQHWCSAIEELAKLIPDHQLTHPEVVYETKYALLNQDVLYGRISTDDAIAQLEEYKKEAQEATLFHLNVGR